MFPYFVFKSHSQEDLIWVANCEMGRRQSFFMAEAPNCVMGRRCHTETGVDLLDK